MHWSVQASTGSLRAGGQVFVEEALVSFRGIIRRRTEGRNHRRRFRETPRTVEPCRGAGKLSVQAKEGLKPGGA
jgi:hypothetical protein